MQVPLEPDAEWIRVWYVVGAIGVAVAAFFIHRYIRTADERFEKDRTNIHDLRNTVAKQDGKIEAVEEKVKLMERLLHRIIDKLFDRKEKP